MKNKIFLVLLIMIITPVMVFADCTGEEIREYRNQLNDVKLDINYKKDKSGDIGNSYVITAKNIPEGIRLMIYNDNVSRFCNSKIKTTFIHAGGIYRIEYVPNNCKDVSLKGFDINLPAGINSNDEVEDFGLDNNKKEVKKSSGLLTIIVACIIAIAVIIIVILIRIKRKKRQITNEV